MALPLPPELIDQIFDSVGHKKDFGTLFTCMTTNSKLSHPAMVTLYKIHDSLPGMAGVAYSDYEKRELHIGKLMILWRSIILSTINKTFYPYCQYITLFDVGALESFIKFLFKKHRENFLPKFFKGDMALFHLSRFPPKGAENFQKFSLDTDATMKRILDALLREPVEPISREVDGQKNIVLQSTEQSFNSRSLRRLLFEFGDLLNDSNIQRALKAKCPGVDSICINGMNRVKDASVACLLEGLPSGSLKSFEFRQMFVIKEQSLLSLRNQSASIVHLSLTIDMEFFYHVYLLAACPNLVTLGLRDRDIINEVDVSSALHKAEIWLSGCKSLREVEVRHRFGPTFVTGMLSEKNIPIRVMKLRPHAFGFDKTFYEVLATKSSLKELRINFLLLSGYNGFQPDSRDDKFLETVFSMKSLESLHLSAEWLEEVDIINIAKRLKQLQCLEIGAWRITNAIWDSLSGMLSLKTFVLEGFNFFTFEGISSFIHKLGPGNKGFSLKVTRKGNSITNEETSSIKSLICSRVAGTFDCKQGWLREG